MRLIAGRILVPNTFLEERHATTGLFWESACGFIPCNGIMFSPYYVSAFINFSVWIDPRPKRYGMVWYGITGGQEMVMGTEWGQDQAVTLLGVTM